MKFSAPSINIAIYHSPRDILPNITLRRKSMRYLVIVDMKDTIGTVSGISNMKIVLKISMDSAIVEKAMMWVPIIEPESISTSAPIIDENIIPFVVPTLNE